MNAQELHFLQAEELTDLARNVVTVACSCGMAAHLGWESITDSQWPAAQMQAMGTLRNLKIAEPTYEEHHPAGTRYGSVDAPVVPSMFPYNRCDVHQCQMCQCYVLRYTEYGGYYVNHRARCLSGARVLEKT